MENVLNWLTNGAFCQIFIECDIVAHYTMPGTHEQNGVAKRQNRTLMDMVRSMMSQNNLSEWL